MIAKCKNIIFSDTFRVNLIKVPWMDNHMFNYMIIKIKSLLYI